VLGAGDGFMSGLLKGWLDGADWPTALTYANACGAFAVSRHGCTPAYPSWEELQFFLEARRRRKGAAQGRRARADPLGHQPARRLAQMRVFAFDHRMQLEDLDGATPDERIGAFKRLCLDAALEVAEGRPGYGILCDGPPRPRRAARRRRHRPLDRPPGRAGPARGR
jgi:5-dehydro-2-deoxygluconokinase